MRPESPAAEAFLGILYNMTNTMSDGSGFLEEYRRPSARETFPKTGHEDAVERVRETLVTANQGVAEIPESLASAAGPAAVDD